MRGGCWRSRWGSSRGRAAAAAGSDPGPRPGAGQRPGGSAPRSGLPAPLTSFVGRQQALAEVAELVPRHRLVTLIGPPGVGKSRLAMAASRAVEHEFVGGVWFVELARAARPPTWPAWLRAHWMPEARRQPATRWRASSNACDADVLLVLDGCEPVLAEAAQVMAGVLAECPGVRVLATSREVLHLEGEVRFVVTPLPVPAAGSMLVSWRPRSRCSCFWSGPRLHGRDCRLPSTTSPWRRRFAAGWTGCRWDRACCGARQRPRAARDPFSARESAAALCRRPRPPGDPQRYLRTVVAWSYDLLHADEKTLLHQLAVFRGGAPLSAAVATAVQGKIDEARATQLMGALVDKSILTASFPDGEPRYDLLDTVVTTPSSSWPKPAPWARPAGARQYCDDGRRCGGGLRGPTGWTAPGGSSWSTTTSGRRGLRATHTTRRSRSGWGQDWLVFPARRAHLRGPQLRSCACVDVVRRAVEQADRAARVPVLPGDRGARPRRRDRLGPSALPLPRPVPQGPSRPSHR